MSSKLCEIIFPLIATTNNKWGRRLCVGCFSTTKSCCFHFCEIFYGSIAMYAFPFFVQIFKHGISCNMNFLSRLLPTLFNAAGSFLFCLRCATALSFSPHCHCYCCSRVRNVESTWRLTKLCCLTIIHKN